VFEEAHERTGGRGKGGYPEAAIVNPLRQAINPDAKVDALLSLGKENVPRVEGILADLKLNMGLDGKWSLKLPERIQAKASRPSIRQEKPWHDIEHVRDGLRFKVSLNSFEQLPGIARTLARHGAKVIKFDTKKMFAPKEYGWRFVAFDIQMPNGQLVEFYAPVPELDNKLIKHPNHLLFEKWRNVSEAEIQANPELKRQRAADIAESKARYDAAFMEAIARMGYSSLEEASAAWNSFVALAESETRENFSASSTALAEPLRQTPAGEQRNEVGTASTRISPSSASDTNNSSDFEVEDAFDSDGAITSDSTQAQRPGQFLSASGTLDLFGSDLFGPVAETKRKAVAAAKKNPAARAGVAKQIAVIEKVADLDLFSESVVKSLANPPAKRQRRRNDSDSGQLGFAFGSDLPAGQQAVGPDRAPRVGTPDGLPAGNRGSRGGDIPGDDIGSPRGDIAGGSRNDGTPDDADGRGGRPAAGDRAGRDGDRQPRREDAGRRSLSERERPPLDSPDRNFRIGKDTVLAEGGAVTRIRLTARKLLLAGRCLRKLMRGPEGGEKGVVRPPHRARIHRHPCRRASSGRRY
jgi:hypothetical protein